MKYLLKTGFVIFMVVLLAGCSGALGNKSIFAPKVSASAGQDDKRLASSQTTTPKPAQSAKTAEQFDTTTAEQRAKAVQNTAADDGERRLGATVGTLGNPAEPGFWLKTPLVSKAVKGRVEYPATGVSVVVELIPIDGPKTAGSRASLSLLRLLKAPLTELADLIVFSE